jgi:hypothetical protein
MNVYTIYTIARRLESQNSSLIAETVTSPLREPVLADNTSPAALFTGRRARRAWRIGNSLVISLDFRDVRRLKLEPGDFVWVQVTAVQLVRRPVGLEISIERALAATVSAVARIGRA